MFIVIIWVLVSLGALFPVALAVWRVRGWVRQHGLRYIIACLLGAALNNLIAAGLALAAVPVVSDNPASLSVVLLTIGHLAQTIPMILFALYLIGIFQSEPERGLL